MTVPIKPTFQDDLLAEFADDPLAEFAEDKKEQLLPVDSTAIAPQAPTTETPTTEGFFAQAPANRPTDTGRIVNDTFNYYENRVDNVINAVISAAETGAEWIKHPSDTAGFLKSSVGKLWDAVTTDVPKAFQTYGVKRALVNKFAGDMILGPLEYYAEHVVGTPLEQLVIDPMVKIATGSFPKSEQESADQTKAAAADIVATVAGYKVGQAVLRAQVLRNASASLAVKLGINPATVVGRETLINKITAMPMDQIIALSKDVPKMIQFQNVMTRAVAEGLTGGAVAGITMPGTPEERFSNAFQMSVAAVPFVLGAHGVFSALGHVKARVDGVPITGESIVREAARQAYTDRQLQGLFNLPPSERFTAAQQFLTNVPVEEVIARNIDRGIVIGIDVGLKEKLGDVGVTYFDHGDGTFSALVDRPKNFDPAAYQEYTEGLGGRVASATAEADAKMMRELEISDPIKHAKIEELTASGNIEAAQALKDAMEQRDFNRREMFKDPLTGAGNRRGFDLALPKAEADPNTQILVSDLDGFKNVNDSHGHPVGDKVLKAFADHVRSIMEKYHLPVRDVFRNGGDEVATFITSSDPTLVQRVKADIDAFKMTVADNLDKPPVEVKASTGSAKTYVKADAEMYKIKRARKGLPPEPTEVEPTRTFESFFTEHDRAHFRATGYVPFQKIVFNGKDWFVKSVVGDKIHLLDADGNSTIAHKSQIIRTPEIEVATPHVPDIDQVLAEPISAENTPREPGFKNTIAEEGFRAELIKPLDQVDINARSQPNQPAYSPDPDVVGKVAKFKNQIVIDFQSYFDKAIWLFVRTADEMKKYNPERKLFTEDRMMKLSKKLGIPIEELRAHKIKLMDAAARAYKEFNEEISEIGFEPGSVAEMGNKSGGYLGIGIIPFEGARSKFMGIDFNKVGKLVDAGKIDDLLTPEEQALITQNKADFTAITKQLLRDNLQNINDNGMIVQVAGNHVNVVGTDGKIVAVFTSIDDALNYRAQANSRSNNGLSNIGTDINGDIGGLKPPVDVGGGDIGVGNLPPDAGNIPHAYTSDGPLLYDKPNWMNRLVGVFQQGRQQYLKPRQGYFRDIAAQLEHPEAHVASRYLDAAALEANAETVRTRSQISEIIRSTINMNNERVKLIINGWMHAVSTDDALSNMPGRRLNIAKPTSAEEFAHGNKVGTQAIAAARQGETAFDAITRASNFIAGREQTIKQFKADSPQYKSQMDQYAKMLKDDPATAQLVKTLDAIRVLSKDQVDLFQVIMLADIYINKSLGKDGFAIANKMTPQEHSIAQRLAAFTRERGAEMGVDGNFLNRQINLVGRMHGGTYEGSIFSLQEGASAAKQPLLSQLVRNMNNVGAESDPFKAANTLANASIRYRILRPAVEEFSIITSRIAQDLRNKGAAEKVRTGSNKAITRYNKMAERFEHVSKNYADEVIGTPDGVDATINHAMDSFSNWFVDGYRKIMNKDPLKPNEEIETDIKRNVVGPLNRLFNLSTQGGNLKAGAIDLSNFLFSAGTKLPADRLLKVIQIAAEASKKAENLQKTGKIQGLQSLVPEDLASQRVSRTGLNLRENFDAFSDIGFELSGQPAVVKYAGAALWTENIGAMAEALKKHGNDPTKVRAELETRVLGPGVNSEISRLILADKSEAAAEFYARSMQEYIMVQYGRATHPAGFGNTIGRLLGTFGTWAFGALDSFVQPYQYGSHKDWIMFSAKVVAAYYGMKKVQEETGLQLRKFMYNPLDWQTWRGSPLVGMGNAMAMYQYARQTGNKKLQAEYEWQIRSFMPNGSKGHFSLIERLIPFDSDDDNWGSIMFPMSVGMQNHREAYEELNNGEVLQAIFRELGIRPVKK